MRRDDGRRGRFWAVLVGLGLGVATLAAAFIGAFLEPRRAAPVGDGAPAYVIAVMTSARDAAVSDTAAAIRAFAERRIAQLNAEGGVRGRAVELRFFDDRGDGDLTVANVETALAEPNLLAILGVWSSTRGARVVDRVGRSGVPFISEISLDAIFAAHPNIFSLTRGVSSDLAIFRRFLSGREGDVVFLGVEDDLFAMSFFHAAEALATEGRAPRAKAFFTPPEGRLAADAADRVVRALKESDGVGALVLAVGSSRGAAFLDRLAAEGLAPTVFLATGALPRMERSGGGRGFRGRIFQTSATVPGVENERLARLLRAPDTPKGAFDERRYGAIYADMIDLLVATANASDAAGLDALRADVSARLRALRPGRARRRGSVRDWSFTASRAAYETAHLVWRAETGGPLRLWPEQASADADAENAERRRVVYASVDLVRIDDVDSRDETFEAEFFLSLESDAAITLADLDFVNVARGDASGAPLLSPRKLSGAFDALTVYKIVGRFQFAPELARYPFDRQVFAISIQPANAAEPFLLQPPPEPLRDRAFETPGWRVPAGAGGHYVSADQDVISVARNGASERRLLAFERYSFVWVAERETLDYYLRVVTPLALIMAVAYLSVFIPKSRFDSAVALQVTALLSAIALYLGIPKLGEDAATLSDQIFVFAEAMIVATLALSILRINSVNAGYDQLSRAIGVAQATLFPVLTLLLMRYVDAVRAGSGETIAEKSFGEALRVLAALVLF